MFGSENGIKTEPTPERVFEVCKILSNNKMEESSLKELIEPHGLNTKGASYFSTIREVCEKELKLIEKKDDFYLYIGDKKIVKNINNFRKYCNSHVFTNRNTSFYKIAKCFLDSNDEWLKYNTLSNVNITHYVQKNTGISLVTEQNMLGMRFWMSFLGFGHVQEQGGKIFFLPNMNVALRDFIEKSNLEKGREYTVNEFVEKIYENATIALENVGESRKFNLALSNALRDMHDNKEIELKNILDSKEIWYLYKDETHKFVDRITHILYKGVK